MDFYQPYLSHLFVFQSYYNGTITYKSEELNVELTSWCEIKRVLPYDDIT